MEITKETLDGCDMAPVPGSQAGYGDVTPLLRDAPEDAVVGRGASQLPAGVRLVRLARERELPRVLGLLAWAWIIAQWIVGGSSSAEVGTFSNS